MTKASLLKGGGKRSASTEVDRLSSKRLDLRGEVLRPASVSGFLDFAPYKNSEAIRLTNLGEFQSHVYFPNTRE